MTHLRWNELEWSLLLLKFPAVNTKAIKSSTANLKLNQQKIKTKSKAATSWKVFKYGVFSGPYFPVFGLNTERYFVSIRIQSKCGKIRTRKNSVFGHFSGSVRRQKIWSFAAISSVKSSVLLKIVSPYLEIYAKEQT